MKERALIVDDDPELLSILKRYLENHGFETVLAADGVKALAAAATAKPDIIITDVDMPRMDGFELTARIRADSRLSDLPVVLVTALESREEKERGIEVGANAYVIKSGFDQTTLLEIIGRLA